MPAKAFQTKVYWVFAEGGIIVLASAHAGIDEDRLEIAAADLRSLSGPEARPRGLVIEGLSLPEIAERMSITANTARTHLNRVFEKTGVRTQPALVRVLLSSAPPV